MVSKIVKSEKVETSVTVEKTTKQPGGRKGYQGRVKVATNVLPNETG